MRDVVDRVEAISQKYSQSIGIVHVCPVAAGAWKAA